MNLGEDLISLVCFVLNALALVSCRKLENLDVMNGGVVRVFIAPTTKSGRWKADCRMAHQTVRCATGHCPVRQPRQATVGF
jgi:protein-disulfide isomerase